MTIASKENINTIYLRREHAHENCSLNVYVQGDSSFEDIYRLIAVKRDTNYSMMRKLFPLLSQQPAIKI